MSTTKTIEAKTINGHQYTGYHLPALKACGIAFKLAGFLNGTNVNIERLIEQEENNLILGILSETMRDGVAINAVTFDNMYQGNLGELVAAVQFAVEANFSDFLQVEGIGFLGEKINLAKEKTAIL